MKYKEHKVFSEDQDDASIKLISDVIRNFDDFDGGEEFVPDDTVNIFNFNGLFENNNEESEEDSLDNFVL